MPTTNDPECPRCGSADYTVLSEAEYELRRLQEVIGRGCWQHLLCADCGSRWRADISRETSESRTPPPPAKQSAS